MYVVFCKNTPSTQTTLWATNINFAEKSTQVVLQTEIHALT